MDEVTRIALEQAWEDGFNAALMAQIEDVEYHDVQNPYGREN